MRQHWQFIAMVAAVFLLWNTPLMIPLKILTVFFHELSHALAALLTGGSVESISISPRQGGLTTTRGGSLFWITSAGYIGSLLFGVALFVLALKSRADKLVMAALGGLLLLVAALYMRTVFALGFTVVSGVAMIITAKYLPQQASDATLRVIGLTSMVYVPFDILSDTILRAGLRSDAYNMAQQFGGATAMWGGLWLLLSVAVIWITLKKGLKGQSRIRF